MEASVFAVEKIIGYTFHNKKLLEHALTHTSYPEADSYEHLEYVGDAVLGLAISSYLFLAYSSVDSDTLSLLRAANVSTEKLARAAIRHGLHSYGRHNMVSIGDEIKEFVDAIGCENYCAGSVKAPKILADIMKSIVAAIFIDVNLDLKRLWVIIKGLLEPMVTLDDLEQNPQPVKMLYEICQKNGKKVDGELAASASSDQKDIARFEAAKAALDKLP